MAAAPHHLIVTKSSYFEQYKSNHYKWRKRTKKYQNDKYVYLTPPPVLLIFIKYTSKLLIFIGVYQIYTLIFYNFTKTKAVLLQATGLKHLAYEILSSE